MTPLALSRIQFAFTISYHIIFPSFSIGLAAWLTVLEGLHLFTKNPVYRRLFDFWLKIFAVAFGMGVVSGIVMGVEFGTNWSRLTTASGPIQGPLLAYESFTAFALEASFFGVLLFGRPRLPPPLYLFSVCMVALGTGLSSFWIMVNNSWMQAPVGYVLHNGAYEPKSWLTIIFNPVVWVRFPHMLLASFLTGAFCVAATGAWFVLRRIYLEEGRAMLRMGLFLAAILMPCQLLLGHLNGDYVHEKQPAKFAAIEARWHDEQPAAEVVIALPDEKRETNHLELKIPVLGSLVATSTLNSREVGLTDFAKQDRPPVAIPFFAFRVMVGCGLVMLAVAWLGSALILMKRLDRSRWVLWATFLSWPLPWIAILTGWFTAEVGRQPWAIYGLMRTADAVTPTLTTTQTTISLLFYLCVHGLIFSFGAFYIFHLLRRGPTSAPLTPRNAKRPLAVTDEAADAEFMSLKGLSS